MSKFIYLLLLSAILTVFCAGCSPQERSGVNPKPFNTPASWETNPYGNNRLQN